MRTARKFIAGLSSLICMSMFLAGCASEDGIYHPGSYTASAAGYAGDVMVEVEFDSEKILSVTILEHNETPTVADKAIEEIPENRDRSLWRTEKKILERNITHGKAFWLLPAERKGF